MAALEKIPKNPDKQVNFPDLEQLLQKSLGSKELRVIDSSATELLPLGENYGSIMVKLDVTIRKSKNDPDEKLFLVAKTMSKQAGEPIIEWAPVLKKELFIYTELVPSYQDLERKTGIGEKDLLDILPKYFGHRFNLEGHSEKVDENSLILMENLKVRGFYTGDRRVGIDVHHARMALRNLARYHALGIVLKRTKPDLFKKAADRASQFSINVEVMDQGFLGILKIFQENPRLNKHRLIIERSFENFIGGKFLKEIPKEPWATITHGDFWVNNLMFHKNELGNVDDVKFVDYQTYLFNSPLKDLPYFMCGSLDISAARDHFDELLDIYYDTFMQTLDRMGCKNTMFSKQEFQAELKKQAILQFPICAIAMKFFVFETSGNEENSMECISKIFASGCNQVFEDKLFHLISVYESRGWF